MKASEAFPMMNAVRDRLKSYIDAKGSDCAAAKELPELQRLFDFWDEHQYWLDKLAELPVNGEFPEVRSDIERLKQCFRPEVESYARNRFMELRYLLDFWETNHKPDDPKASPRRASSGKAEPSSDPAVSKSPSA